MPLGLSANEKRLRREHVSIQQTDFVQSALNGGVALKHKTISALARFHPSVRKSREVKAKLREKKQKCHWSHPYGQYSHKCPQEHKLVKRDFTCFHHLNSDDLAQTDWYDERLVTNFFFSKFITVLFYNQDEKFFLINARITRGWSYLSYF